MLFVFFPLFLGVLTGALFRVQTLFLLMLFLATGAVCGRIAGVSIGVGDWVGVGIALQLGYLGGVFLRSVLGRFAAGIKLHARSRIQG